MLVSFLKLSKLKIEKRKLIKQIAFILGTYSKMKYKIDAKIISVGNEIDAEIFL